MGGSLSYGWLPADCALSEHAKLKDKYNGGRILYGREPLLEIVNEIRSKRRHADVITSRPIRW